MRKIRVVLPAVFLILCMVLASCAAPQQRIEPWGTPEEAARTARDLLLKEWQENPRIRLNDSDVCLDIRCTRVFTIAEHPEAFREDGQPLSAASRFDGVACVVEFTLLTDNIGYGSAPYTFFGGNYDHVILYRDGTSDVPVTSPFRSYAARVYSWDFTGIIASVTDLGTALNGVWHLK